MTTGAKPRTTRASKSGTASKSTSTSSAATVRGKADTSASARATATPAAGRRKTSTKAVPPAAKAPKTPAAATTAAAAKGAMAIPVGAATMAKPDRARRRDLLNVIASRSDLPRDDLKDAMDLILEEMGKMLDAGEQVALPPLGKLNVKKRVERSGATVLTVKLRRPDTGRR